MFDLTATDYQAVLLSAKVALTATVLALPAGFLAASLLAFGRFRGKGLLEGLLHLPMVLPPVVVGYLLLLLLGENGPLGPFMHATGLRIIFTWWAAVIASLVVGFPLLVRAIRIGLEDIDEKLLQSARTLGAPWYDTLLSIVLPLSGRAVLAGASLMFARSLGEFGATIILAGNIPGLTQTIPLAIYDYVNSPGGDRGALALCLLSIGLSLAVLLCSETLIRALARRSKP
jgi:molybdate transport system permease protein